ncbi:DeoR/GlpR family DNA-binding transcription regulator [Floccifex sp.]|uniref:DeoR/GlpR family DNA-binding transcription regulator n=1 Tax=Floccifex sp. TaxID=2815810 RepID=UPI003F12B6A6
MLQKERHDHILAKLNLESSVRVRDIASEYNVTEDCIRKDLAILEKEGKLKRIHGGAISIRENPHTFNVSARLDKYVEEKKIIAQKAISLIKPGAMIFLGISTSNIELAKLIYQRNLNITVVTNSVDILLIFCGECDVNLIFIGGELNKPKDGFLGSFTNEIIQNYQFDMSFIGVVGINLKQNQLTTYDINDGMTKKQVLACSKVSYIVVESAKFEQDGNFVFAKLESFDGIITDKVLNGKQKTYIEKKGLQII